MMKKILTFICLVMVFLPWTILPLRANSWALLSPAAEIIICGYAAFMIFSGIFTILVYAKGKVKNKIMQITLVINTIYGFSGLCLLGMALYTWMSC